ncbi:flagellar hook-associated protein 1 FlgK [Rhodobium orientis]|uniref:Flagellar hook-associated protein 1 n=1 Tax=Rhodobium orientis TaxID=34017 RepID=A0A327JP75_9HYPH|nr:flagellar hook-associated protein FlgK [Rhodobium orientis]MBB4301839.1 flagellar hook-associated protein 1 FlgK [Rhodobium orientis]MBK5948386.1 flagellar hook-associated protein FlgK [Rhodobium orientis]RAI25218.1 flagellar hook-associated protein FlgK [Rhodobium orientis]
MGITAAVNISLSGLAITQRELEIVASNIANADTPGYTRKSLITENLADRDGSSLGVREVTIQRNYDSYVAAQYRNSVIDGSYLDVMASFQSRLDAMYGTPGDVNALDTIYNDFTSAIEALATSPSDYTARRQVVTSAQTLTSQLNNLSDEIQSMRAESERVISDYVSRANQLLGDLEDVNRQVVSFSSTGAMPVDLLDTRDSIVLELSQMMDIKVSEADNNSVRLFTSNGTLLFDDTAATLSFDPAASVDANATWSADPAESGLGSIYLTSDNGYKVDLIADKAIQSGEIAAYIDLRDDVLVEAQAQLDEFASNLSLALSNRTEEGTAVTVGTSDGFDIDLTDLQQGNPITFEYVDVGSGETQTYTFIRVDDPTMLPLDDDATARADDTVVGIDFSSGLTAAAADIGAALGVGFTVSDEGGGVLRILDDGGTTTTVSSLSASVTNTGLTDEGVEFALFVDGGSGANPYTGDFEGTSQKVGFAGRIGVNKQIINDPSLLVTYETTPAETSAGDPTRPLAIIDALSQATYTFSADSGLGSDRVPYAGTVSGFLASVVNYRGSEMASATRAADSRQAVTQSLNERLSEVSAVDVDQELSALIELQSAYTANARVMQAAREMIDTLMGI